MAVSPAKEINEIKEINFNETYRSQYNRYKTISHLFFYCTHIQDTWNKYQAYFTD